MLTFVVVTALALAPAADAKQSRVTSTEAAKKKGLTIVKTLDADIDGDGKKELVAMCTGDKGLQLAILGDDDKGAVVTAVLPPFGGKELKKFEAQKLVPPENAAEIVVEAYDDTPDEKIKRIRIYTGFPKPREIFTSVIFRPKSEDDRDDWEKDKSIVPYGDAHAGWYVTDLQNDGISEVMVRRKPKVLTVAKDDGDPVKLLIGVYEAMYTFEGGPDSGVFQENKTERFNDFLPAYAVASTEASSAWVDPTVLKDLKAQALSAALSNATDGKETKDPVVDLHPFIKAIADKDLGTAWIEDAKTDGKGEWVELKLDEAHPIHMVRVVSGCVADRNEFKGHNVPDAFDIQLDGGAKTEVNRRERGKPDRPAIAITEVPTKDRPFAGTTLVFFDGKQTAQTVRITLESATRQGKGNQTCISEVSVH